MDSRIREIEQWVAEAKAGLDDCGRDAYLNKLYLLDAEIRAVIKENGIPDAVSPRRQPGSVRRLVTAALPIAGSLSVLVLLAATVYLAIQQRAPVHEVPVISAAPAPATEANPADESPLMVLGYVPASISGEEILGPGWSPADEVSIDTPPKQVTEQPAAAQPARENSPAPVIMAAAPPNTNINGNPVVPANLATDLIALAPAGGNPVPAARPPAGNSNTATGSTSFMNSELEHTVAAKFSYFPESGDEPEIEVNKTKEQLGSQILGQKVDEPSVDSVDSSDATEEASVDNSEPELDSTALAKLLEEKISKRSQR